MKFNKTEIHGVYLIENSPFTDNRGAFSKIYHKSSFQSEGIDFEIKEHFFSVSARGVIRGMHFQAPPFAQEKLVYVPKGRIVDVIADLRRNSPSYGKYIMIELSGTNNNSVFIPQGCAHGFQCLEDNTITVYSQGKEFDKSSDMGVNPFSFEIPWPLSDYIISDKDRSFIPFNLFQSPFES
jgi:dTDP-4-dehydrorhamnose 3,5-epimerase